MVGQGESKPCCFFSRRVLVLNCLLPERRLPWSEMRERSASSVAYWTLGALLMRSSPSLELRSCNVLLCADLALVIVDLECVPPHPPSPQTSFILRHLIPQ